MERNDFKLPDVNSKPVGSRFDGGYERLEADVDRSVLAVASYRWWFFGFLLWVVVFVLAATALALTVENTNKDNVFRDAVLAQLATEEAEEEEEPPLIIPCDQLSASTAYELFHGTVFSKAFEGVDGFDCFPFNAFGADQVCLQVDSTVDPTGTIDVSVWHANSTASGIEVPGHEHDCSDETWFVVEGECAWWWDSSGSSFTDFMGVTWANFQVVAAPGMTYKAKGTAFSWACEPGSIVYATFSPGNVAGLIKALAVDVFGPTPTLPVTRATVEGLAHAHCTVFRPEALDVVFP